jgi:hypothetical protein
MNTNRSGPGCFGYGCLIAVVLFTVVIGGTAYWARKGIRTAVQQYTVESAPTLDIPPVGQEAVSAGLSKFAQVKEALATERPVSVSLSEDELRGVIQASPFKDRLEVSLASGEPSVRFSMPLSIFGGWEAASFLVDDIAKRSVHGSAQGNVSIIDGKPSLRLSALTLNNVQLGEMPRGHAEEWILGAIVSYAGGQPSGKNEFKTDGTWINRVKSLRIEQGAVKLELK